MLYRFLADAVVLTHFLWILFLLFGAVWGRRIRVVKVIHVSGLAFAFIIEVFNFNCPLTYIEVWARSRQFPASNYAGAFVTYYMEKLIYIELPRHLVAVFTSLLCGFNAWFYLRHNHLVLDKKL